MFKIITNNFWIKIVCAFVAIGIWVYVVNSESKVDNFPGTINLDIKNKPADLVAIKDVDTVNLKIIAERGVWKKLSADSFEAYLDLSGLSEGTHEIPVKINTNIEGVQVVEISPAKVLVRLEPLTTKTVQVGIRTDGQAADGYYPGDAISMPESVDVSGPKSAIEGINEAIALIHLNGESEKIENRQATLVAYDEKNEILKNIEFNPKEVKVSLGIVKGSQTKSVGIKVNTSGNVGNGYYIGSISVDPSTIVITGSAKVLGQTDYLETESINISDLISEKTQTVNLIIPPGVGLVSGQKNQVTAKIKLSQATIQKEITAKHNYLNLSSNLRIESISPSNIKITVSGSVDKISGITSQDVIVNFDFLSKTNGTFTYNVSDSQIITPNGISIVNIVPTSVSITLVNK